MICEHFALQHKLHAPIGCWKKLCFRIYVCNTCKIFWVVSMFMLYYKMFEYCQVMFSTDLIMKWRKQYTLWKPIEKSLENPWWISLPGFGQDCRSFVWNKRERVYGVIRETWEKRWMSSHYTALLLTAVIIEE